MSDLKTINGLIASGDLPSELNEIFPNDLDCNSKRFLIQEGYIIDYKEDIPDGFSKGYGAGIIRLCIGFYNTFGGLIVFGVRDADKTVIGCNKLLNVEGLTEYLRTLTKQEFRLQHREYRLKDSDLHIQIVMVPKRKNSKPARLLLPLENYAAGTLWIREQHEVLKVSTYHLPLIFSPRDNYLLSAEQEETVTIHKSLPPSPATIKDFVGRQDLLLSLWEWFIYGEEPRIYLHGPGGSGKSTIAFEFARTIANSAGQLRISGSEKIDYIVYLSGKETELDPIKGSIGRFELQDFDTADTQYMEILYHTGILTSADLTDQSIDVDTQLRELFDNYNGLIVLDDIDALSRRKVDTGEETLFFNIVRARKKAKVLYTTRFEPSYSRSSLKVPGLDYNLELPEFVRICAEQFGVPGIGSLELAQIADKTHSLPLLIETIIGLRRDCGNYATALRLFQDKGGDESRAYLYKREYERLAVNGRARPVLAALQLLDTGVTFDTLANILPFPEEEVKDAISEISGIFLSKVVSDGGESQYRLAPPCTSLIKALSRNLDYFNAIERTVRLHKQSTLRLSPSETACISRFERKLKIGQADSLILEAEAMLPTDPIRVTREFNSLVGQAYTKSSKPNYTKARELFRSASNKGCRDIFMMRTWYFVEMQSGFSLDVAEEICNVVIEDKNMSNRYRAEFLAKLGSCLSRQASHHTVTDLSRAISLLQRSLVSYFDSVRIGRDVPEIDNMRHSEWLTRTAEFFFRCIRDDVEPVFRLVDMLATGKNDIDLDAVHKIIRPIRTLAEHPDRQIRNKSIGLAGKSLQGIKRIKSKQPDWLGINYIYNILYSMSTTPR